MEGSTKNTVISITVRQLSDNSETAYAADIKGKITGLVFGDTLDELIDGVKFALHDL
jgi:hypothetical protein